MRRHSYSDGGPSYGARLYTDVIGDLSLRLADKPRAEMSVIALFASNLMWVATKLFMCFAFLAIEFRTLWLTLTTEPEPWSAEDLRTLDLLARNADADLLPFIDTLRQSAEQELIEDGKAAEIVRIRSGLALGHGD